MVTWPANADDWESRSARITDRPRNGIEQRLGVHGLAKVGGATGAPGAVPRILAADEDDRQMMSGAGEQGGEIEAADSRHLDVGDHAGILIRKVRAQEFLHRCKRPRLVLNMGIYEGADNRLVGTRTIPFAELTPEYLRQEVQKAMAQQVSALLDSDALRDYLDAAARKTLPRF